MSIRAKILLSFSATVYQALERTIRIYRQSAIALAENQKYGLGDQSKDFLSQAISFLQAKMSSRARKVIKYDVKREAGYIEDVHLVGKKQQQIYNSR